MSLNFEEPASLQAHNSLGLIATADRLFHLTARSQLTPLLHWIKTHQQPVLWLGGGSNLVLAERVPGLVVKVELTGRFVESERADEVMLRVEAGECWHDLVLYCLERGYHGLENLALIPGTVGAAPVQNIGAYGVEVAQWIRSIEVLDLTDGQVRWLDLNDCQFAYRDSRFKRHPGRYLILSVRFALTKRYQPKTDYAALAAELSRLGVNGTPTPHQLVEAVCAVRSSKLPDPRMLGNAGSFFKNPVVSSQQFSQLAQRYPEIPNYPDPQGRKLAAGWLIDQCGWRGKTLGPVGVHDRQALVLVNLGGARKEDLDRLSAQIKESVWQRFSVRLEQEPVTYPS